MGPEDEHGTKVASVIIGYTGPYVRVGSLRWDFIVYDGWHAVRNDCLTDGQSCEAARDSLKNEFRFYSDLWESFPIINSSHGLAEDQTILPNLEEELVPRVMRQINRTNPALWTRYTQADRDADMRSIHVRSTGHNRAKGGFEIVNFHRLLTQSNPELWDHTLFVTALDPRTGRLVDGEHPCGPLPTDWEPDVHGRHFCVAARGVHCSSISGGPCDVLSGSSYAAPYVAAILAELYVRCGFDGRALLKLLLDTANRDKPYDEIETYGAGVVSMERATDACNP